MVGNGEAYEPPTGTAGVTFVRMNTVLLKLFEPLSPFSPLILDTLHVLHTPFLLVLVAIQIASVDWVSLHCLFVLG